MHEFYVLTKRKTGGSHRQTKVVINFDGITAAQLQTLACHAILWRLQNEWKNSSEFTSIPEEFSCDAKDMVQLEPITAPCINPPKQYSWIDKLLEGLSAEEAASLLQELKR